MTKKTKFKIFIIVIIFLLCLQISFIWLWNLQNYSKQLVELKNEITTSVSQIPKWPNIENKKKSTNLKVRFPFVNHKITFDEMEHFLPPAIVSDCHFCEYPTYEKAFRLINEELSYVTAFLKSVDYDTGTELVIISYIPVLFN
jgi:hypothetical protein